MRNLILLFAILIVSCGKDSMSVDPHVVVDPPGPSVAQQRTERLAFSREWSRKITHPEADTASKRAGVGKWKIRRPRPSNKGLVGALVVDINGIAINLTESERSLCVDRADGEEVQIIYDGFINVPNSLEESQFTREVTEIATSTNASGTIVEHTVIVNYTPTAAEIAAETGLSVNDFEVDDPNVSDYNDITVEGIVAAATVGPEYSFFYVDVRFYTPTDLEGGRDFTQVSYESPRVYEASVNNGSLSLSYS